MMGENNISFQNNIELDHIITWLSEYQTKYIINMISESKFKNEICEFILPMKKNISDILRKKHDIEKVFNDFKLIQQLKDSSIKSAIE